MVQTSLQRRILFGIGLSMTLVMAVAIGLFSMHVRQTTRERVLGDVRALMALKASEAKAYLLERSRIPEVALTDPGLQAWMGAHTQRTGVTGWAPYQARFKQLLADGTLKSVFFASAATGEYFSDTGCISTMQKDGKTVPYDARQRPWWNDTLNRGRLWVSTPTADINGVVSAPIQMPVKSPQGELLGIGGVDLSLQSLTEMVKTVRYQETGFAFLADRSGRLVVMAYPGKDISMNTSLSDLDGQLESRGFGDLTQEADLHRLSLKGEDHLAVVAPIQATNPAVDWRLGLVVPASAIDGPVRKATWGALSIGLLCLGVMLAATHLIARSIVRPLQGAAEAMADIAQGEGDLTRRLSVGSSDELGLLASSFNGFVERLQGLLLEIRGHSTAVREAAGNVSDLGGQLHREMETERRGLADQARLAGSVAEAFQRIQSHASQALEAAERAGDASRHGLDLAEGAQSGIMATAAQLQQATEALEALVRQAEDIGEVVSVIEGFSNQTNLLALNAAIEAAHAGIHGRGFAVVANEVRVLAGRTADSVAQIQKIVAALQGGVATVAHSMEATRQQSDASVEKTVQVHQALAGIHASVSDVQRLNEAIGSDTEARRAEVMASHERVQELAGLSDRVAELAEDLEGHSGALQTASEGLAGVVGQFNV